MPRRNSSPADEGIQAAREERAAMEQAAETQQADQPVEPAAASMPPMKIDVRITGTRNFYDDPTRATASVTLNDCFVIKGFRVIKSENGLFCSMPSRRLKNGEYSEICHAITPDFSRQLSASVLNEYQVYLAQQMEESQQTPHVYEPEPEQTTPAMEEPPFEPDMEM